MLFFSYLMEAFNPLNLSPRALAVYNVLSGDHGQYDSALKKYLKTGRIEDLDTINNSRPLGKGFKREDIELLHGELFPNQSNPQPIDVGPKTREEIQVGNLGTSDATVRRSVDNGMSLNPQETHVGPGGLPYNGPRQTAFTDTGGGDSDGSMWPYIAGGLGGLAALGGVGAYAYNKYRQKKR